MCVRAHTDRCPNSTFVFPSHPTPHTSLPFCQSIAFKNYKLARETEELAECQKSDYERYLSRREEGLNISAAEADLINNTTPEGMDAYVIEKRGVREKAQQRKTTLTDQLESLETKASNITFMHQVVNVI